MCESGLVGERVCHVSQFGKFTMVHIRWLEFVKCCVGIFLISFINSFISKMVWFKNLLFSVFVGGELRWRSVADFQCGEFLKCQLSICIFDKYFF